MDKALSQAVQNRRPRFCKCGTEVGTMSLKEWQDRGERCETCKENDAALSALDVFNRSFEQNFGKAVKA